jgi:hypothetical protein
MRCVVGVFLLLLFPLLGKAGMVLIPMDEAQTNHLKAYGIAYGWLQKEEDVDWLLNYRGGSFMMLQSTTLEAECRIRGVWFELLTDSQAAQLKSQIAAPHLNMDVVTLRKAAKIVVYSPVNISRAAFEDTDAVLLVLRYAEIPFKVVYDEEILRGDLAKYDWLHLHHEDFTGQFGRNMRRMSAEDLNAQKAIAKRYKFGKVSEMKLAVAKAIKGFCAGGGYLFAMCSAAETLDIALAAEGVDIVDSQFDGDGVDAKAQDKLDFGRTLAFGNFTLELENDYGNMSSFSDINISMGRWGSDQPMSYFRLFDFSAKWDVIPTMLTQNHEKVVREFFGQTSGFRKSTVKPNALVMGESPGSHRYLYGELGVGQWTFYSGHDPEGMRGGGFRMPTDLNLFPHSPGYRLILNNVLFPSARKKKRKT